MRGHLSQFISRPISQHSRQILQVERLQDRITPSCSMVVIDGHILRIVGDDSDNRVAVADLGGGRVVVTCDTSATRTLTGIDRVGFNGGR